MTPTSPTTTVLNPRLGWRSNPAAGPIPDGWPEVAASGPMGLRLAVEGGSAPLSLDCADGSLGGLLLPRGFAIDRELRLSVLVREDGNWLVRRYDPATLSFHTILGFGGPLAGTIDAPLSMLAAGSVLCVPAPEAGAVLRYDLDVQAPLPALTVGRKGWRPIDVATRPERDDGTVFVLSSDGDIRAWRMDAPGQCQLVARRTAGPAWRRLAIDGAGDLYVLIHDRGTPVLVRLPGPDAPTERRRPRSLSPLTVGTLDPADRNSDANDLRRRFPAPWVRLWVPAGRPVTAGLFYLPPGLAARCGRQRPAPPPPEDPLAEFRAARIRHLEDGLDGTVPGLFGRDGRPAAPPPPLAWPSNAYRSRGEWFSAAIDSGLYDCQWDKVTVELACLPTGTTVEVATFSSNQPDGPRDLSTRESPAGYLWATNYCIKAPAQNAGDDPNRVELLVQSRQGRYLHLRLRFTSDGRDTPVVTSLRLDYPRRSYLRLLPPVFGADDSSRWFLERFLSIFQTTWDRLRADTRSLDRYFIPDAVPSEPYLRYLASWLAQPLETASDAEGVRRLLRAAVRHYPRRGTPEAVRGMLQACLANLTGGRSLALPGFPAIVEGFRERTRVVLSLPATGGLDDGATLWSPSVTGRLQVGEFARVGETRIMTAGDERSDYLARHANAFTVCVPACWLDDDRSRRLFAQAVADEAPAHAIAVIREVEAGMRVGLQSTVGIDTIIGTYPVAATADGAATDPGPDLDYAPILSQVPPPAGAAGNPRLP